MKITVIIPTRERADTLRAALKTCTQQRYDDLEILVSDNASTDGTAEVVRSFADRRIRYLNTETRLAMSANWEFALSHVKSGYVTIIGDDDGLLPDAVAELAQRLDELGRPPLFGWQKAVYYWPSFYDTALRNLLTVPLTSAVVQQDARLALHELMTFRRSYGLLPGLYNAVADVELVRAITARTGTFFRASSPDVYSAIVLSAAVSAFPFSSRPYGVGGQSAHSTGSSYMSGGRDGQAAARFTSEGNIAFHEELVCAPSLAIITAEAYLQAKAAFPELSDYERRRTLAAALAEAAPCPPDRYLQVRDVIRAICERHGQPALAHALEEQFPNRPVRYETPLGWNWLRGVVTVRADRFAAHDVFEAAALARHLLAIHEHHYFEPTGVLRTAMTAGVQAAARRVYAEAERVREAISREPGAGSRRGTR